MKKTLITLMLAVIATMTAGAQWGIGLRDNRYVYADYTLRNHYTFTLEESIFSEKIQFQYLRGYVGYKNAWRDLQYQAQAYFGSTYNGSWSSGGIMLQGRYKLWDRLIILGKLNPHYDSYYHYTTAYLGGLGVSITRQLDILAAFANLPEYRISERRVRLGLDFHVENLTVRPFVSVATQGAYKAKNLRVTVDFNYTFPTKKQN